MLHPRSDADMRDLRPVLPNTESNVNSITTEVITQIEKELDSPYDMISLVFLLYEVPDTALQRLLVYQQVCKDQYSTTNMNLLQEWALGAKIKLSWREEFLEALLICQLYGIVRKLGFNIETLKRQYKPDNIHFSVYVNRTKKTLYKLSENIDSNNLNRLKSTLLTYHIDTSEYDSCELIFLKLMSEKIISLSDFRFYDKSLRKEFNFHKLVKFIQKLPGLESYATELWVTENQNGGECIGLPVASSSPSEKHNSDISVALPNHSSEKHLDPEMENLLEMLGDLNVDEMKSDSKITKNDYYEIKNPEKIGVCLVINQEVFHFCDQSIEDKNLKALQTRYGSKYDKIEFERTMSSLNFDVISKDNLNHEEMIDFIKEGIKKHVKKSTSIFMLCIMSHGVREHVYAADSIKVKIENIQKLLDSDNALSLLGIPKVLIIQACQVDDVPHISLMADSPSTEQFRLCKTDFLVYWATSPELEAFRSETQGSIFIQFLCMAIKKLGRHERLEDIFTKVNNIVSMCCNKYKVLQTPVFVNSLRKKLYLFDPKSDDVSKLNYSPPKNYK